MRSPNWNDDDQLMMDISDALRPPPPVDEQILAAARGAFAWRTVDADLELALMFYDSELDDGALVRGPQGGGPRTLAFQGEALGVEIELSDAGIEGQLIPPQPGRVTLMNAEGTVAATDADAVGCFTFQAPPRGPVRLECATDGCRLRTEWIT